MALFVLALFANFVVLDRLVVAGDPAATAANIADAPGLFRLGIVAFVAVFVIDVVVAWALFVLFRDKDRDLSLASAWFRLAYTVMLGVGAVFLVQALQLLDGVGLLAERDPDVLQAQALVAVDSFDATWLIGLVALGPHLVLLGALLIGARWAPRLLAILLMVAGVTYVIDTGARLLLSNYQQYESAFPRPSKLLVRAHPRGWALAVPRPISHGSSHGCSWTALPYRPVGPREHNATEQLENTTSGAVGRT